MKDNKKLKKANLIKKIQNYLDYNYTGVHIKNIYGNYILFDYKHHKFSVRLSFLKDYKNKDSETLLNSILTGNSTGNFLNKGLFFDNDGNYIEFWGNNLTYINNRLLFGFYNQNTSYAEFLMEENLDILVDNNLSNGRKILTSFIIQNKHFRKITFELVYPTNMFRLILASEGFTLWNHHISLKINNVYNKNELNKYLHQFIFINSIYNTVNENPLILFGINKTYRKPYVYLADEKIEPQVTFPEAKEIQPLIFYNSGLLATHEEKFLNYYKVLEYFFYRNKKNKYKINNEITYKSEKECLKTILSDINYKCNNSIKRIINDYEYRDIYPSYCDKYDKIYIGKFSKILYDLRCKIAHAKDTKNLLVHSTSLVELADSNYIIKWNEIIKRISFICIKCYCYNNINFKKLFHIK